MAREPPLERKGKRIHFWWDRARRLIRESYDGATGASPVQQYGGRAGMPSTPQATYFCVGAGFCGAAGGVEGAAGVAGCDFVCVCFTPESTDVGPVPRAAKIESEIDDSIKIM